MSDLPSATTRIVDQSTGVATGVDLLAVWAPVASNADGVPRLYASTTALIDAHKYCEAAEYAALHFDEVKAPLLFIPLPIETAGSIGRVASSHTGSSAVTVAAGADGVLATGDGVLRAKNSGTVGTDQIILELSMDRGITFKTILLGTATSFVVPDYGDVVSFTVGTLVAGETILSWHDTPPRPGATGQATAIAKMREQLLLTRKWLAIDEVAANAEADAWLALANGYETNDERFNGVKVQVRDRLPPATMSQVQRRMTGSPTITFADVGAGNDTVTRGSGSFVSDSFTNGDTVRITGAVASAGANNVTGVVTVAASVLTFPSASIALTAEGPISGVSITAEMTLTFGDNGASPDTITRNSGSWLDDGFRVGDSITITGTASNNVTKTITALTATVLSVATGSFAAEVIGSYGVAIATGESDAAWVADIDAEFADIDGEPRINLGAGRLTKRSPITGYAVRRPVQWADCIRAFQHDVRTATWRKKNGPLSGWGMVDADGVKYEHDERIAQNLLPARFTCARTYSNGPRGAFIAKSLTRAGANSILSLDHNADCANVMQTVVQAVTETWIGETMQLQPANELGQRFATEASLNDLEQAVNDEVAKNMLTNIGGEGPRASVARWAARRDDDLGVPDATIHGVGTLELNGTIVHVSTSIGVK